MQSSSGSGMNGHAGQGVRVLAHTESIDPEGNGRRDFMEEGSAHAGILISDVGSERVSWLWRGWLASGKLSVMDGDPGLGKSAAVLDLAARVSAGLPFPNGTRCEAGGVVILSAEDGLADTIKPRLEAAGADTSRISSLATVVAGTGSKRHERLFSLPKDIPILEREIDRVGAKLVIVDPLMAFLAEKIDAHKDQDVRRALAPLAAMADRTGVAVHLVRHLSKGESKNPIYRGGGSIGIIGAARMGSLVAVDPQDENRRVLAPTKNNLTMQPKSLTYSLEEAENGAVKVVWTGESDLSASDLLQTFGETEPEVRGEAEQFLLSLLEDGPVPSEEIFKAAKTARISESTLRRAKKKLRAVAERENIPGGKRGDGKWVWKLPEAMSVSDEVQGVQGRGRGPLEREQETVSAKSGVGKPILQDVQEDPTDVYPQGVDHLEDVTREVPVPRLLAGEIARELNRPGSRSGEIMKIYERGDIPLSTAVESVTKAILRKKGEDETRWPESAPVVEAVLTHPVSCECERCV